MRHRNNLLFKLPHRGGGAQLSRPYDGEPIDWEEARTGFCSVARAICGDTVGNSEVVRRNSEVGRRNSEDVVSDSQTDNSSQSDEEGFPQDNDMNYDSQSADTSTNDDDIDSQSDNSSANDSNEEGHPLGTSTSDNGHNEGDSSSEEEGPPLIRKRKRTPREPTPEYDREHDEEVVSLGSPTRSPAEEQNNHQPDWHTDNYSSANDVQARGSSPFCVINGVQIFQQKFKKKTFLSDIACISVVVGEEFRTVRRKLVEGATWDDMNYWLSSNKNRDAAPQYDCFPLNEYNRNLNSAQTLLYHVQTQWRHFRKGCVSFRIAARIYDVAFLIIPDNCHDPVRLEGRLDAAKIRAVIVDKKNNYTLAYPKHHTYVTLRVEPETAQLLLQSG